MKMKDIIESGGSANPFAAMASSIDFVIKQVQNLEKIFSGVTHNIPDDKLKSRVSDAGELAKGHIERALSQLIAAREAVENRSDAPLPPSPEE